MCGGLIPNQVGGCLEIRHPPNHQGMFINPARGILYTTYIHKKSQFMGSITRPHTVYPHICMYIYIYIYIYIGLRTKMYCVLLLGTNLRVTYIYISIYDVLTMAHMLGQMDAIHRWLASGLLPSRQTAEKHQNPMIVLAAVSPRPTIVDYLNFSMISPTMLVTLSYPQLSVHRVVVKPVCLFHKMY